jgi:hypothetical protein
MKNKDYHTTGTDCRKRQNRKPVIKTKVHIPIRYTQSRKNRKPNNLKVFGSKKTKGLKHDTQIQLRLTTIEGDKPMLIK